MKDFLRVYSRENGMSTDGQPPSLWSALQCFADLSCLELSDEDVTKLNKMEMISDAIAFIDQKATARRKNDCLVRYGKNWPNNLRNLTRSMLTSDGTYPRPYFMKHILARKGQIIPKPDYFDGFCVIVVTYPENNLLYEYATLSDLIDDGWVVD